MLTYFSIICTWFSSKRTSNNANSTNRAGKGSPILRTVGGERISSIKRGYLFYSLQSQPPKNINSMNAKNVKTTEMCRVKKVCHLRMETYFRVIKSQVVVVLFITINLDSLSFPSMISG